MDFYNFEVWSCVMIRYDAHQKTMNKKQIYFHFMEYVI